MKIDFKNNVIAWFDENVKLHAHKPLSTSFKEIEVMKDGKILILEDYYEFQFNGKSNLYCLSRKLELEWHLEYPYEENTERSGYTGLSIHGLDMYVNTFNCIRVKFDKDGKILDRKFVK